MYYYKYMPSPVGKLTLISGDNQLTAVLWENDRPNRVQATPDLENNTHPVLLEAEKQLQEYFDGQRNQFDLPLNPIGTDFQKEVWRVLASIPYGSTLSYADIARKLGNLKAVRAVGAANGRNPLSIIVPCHRVIGTDGKLTGFAGGLEAKAWLLSREGITSAPAAPTQLSLL